MKKFLQSVVARACCVLLLGILLIVFSKEITTWIVMVCGLLFIVPGLVSLISYFRRDPEGRGVMLYPVVAAGSILFGLVQIIWPELFLEAMMYILAGVLLLAAATQFYSLWQIHRGGVRFSALYYLVPVLELAAGLYVALFDDKVQIAGLPVIVTGCGFVVYALLDLWTVWLVRKAPTSPTGVTVIGKE